MGSNTLTGAVEAGHLPELIADTRELDRIGRERHSVDVERAVWGSVASPALLGRGASSALRLGLGLHREAAADASTGGRT
ncbi:MAG: hypothetical protein Q8N26_32255 [Myxococcales bacterium]|nr:hypothetical protein [Myxococcales bacterium]